MKKLLPVTLLLLTLIGYAQGPQGQQEPIKNNWNCFGPRDKQPLEYATFGTAKCKESREVTGGITDATGKFDVEASPGNYNIQCLNISPINLIN